MEHYAVIAPTNIEEISIYINSGRKTLEQIVSETGADYAINGGLFNADWTACNKLKAGGSVYADDRYTYYGLAWDDDETELTPAHSDKMGDYDNYIAFVTLIHAGKAIIKPTYPAAVAGARQRTAIGVDAGGNIWLYINDGGLTPEELRDKLLEKKLTEAVMLDGGGSTQGYFRGTEVKSSRIVQNLILVKLKKTTSTYADAAAELIKAGWGSVIFDIARKAGVI